MQLKLWIHEKCKRFVKICGSASFIKKISGAIKNLGGEIIDALYPPPLFSWYVPSLKAPSILRAAEVLTEILKRGC